MKTISTRIVSLRKDAGLSQQQLADDLNLSRRAISLWETGRRAPDLCSPLYSWPITFIPCWTIWLRGEHELKK